MPPINLLIKPASSLCNLRCKYCFYHDVAENREKQSYGIMSLSLLEQLVEQALAYATDGCTFAFQGGEPTLAGLDFFRELIRLQGKYNIKKLPIYNTIQTNGMVIDREWAQFLAENHFLVGLSLDGPKEIHDALRVDALGNGSFARIMETVKLFEQYNVEYNILCVVNNFVARHPDKVYKFYKKNGFRYLQFIPCLDPLGQEQGTEAYSLTPQRYGQFLKRMFDFYYEDFMQNDIMSIRTFDNYVGMLMGYPPESCGMSGICNCYFVIEGDGSVYPCDFYVIDQWLLGNIQTHTFAEMQKSAKAKEFVEASKPVDAKCKACRYYPICRGGCRRNREPFVNGAPVLNHFCSSYIDFFDYALPRLEEMAGIVSQRNRQGGK